MLKKKWSGLFVCLFFFPCLGDWFYLLFVCFFHCLNRCFLMKVSNISSIFMIRTDLCHEGQKVARGWMGGSVSQAKRVHTIGKLHFAPDHQWPPLTNCYSLRAVARCLLQARLWHSANLRHSFTSPSKYMIRPTQQHTPHPWWGVAFRSGENML